MTKPPPLDVMVGMGAYSTDQEGRGGRIRAEKRDFAVHEVLSEISQRRIRDEGAYAVYELAKEGIDTGHCVSDVYRQTRMRIKALGLKDATACTKQYVCASARGPGVSHLAGSRYALRRIGYVDRPLTAKAMIGNRFDIVVRDGRSLEGASLSDLILNYYGYQRFGSRRPMTHLAGRSLVRGDIGEALRLILSETSPFDTPQSNDMRRAMADPSRYKECLDMLPRSMDIERAVIKSLTNGASPEEAFRSIPLYLRRLYVQAYSSYIFNLTLTAAFLEGYDITPQAGDVCFDGADQLGKYGQSDQQRLAVPMVGYSYYAKTRFHKVISDILAAEDISPRDFYIKPMQEISAEGGFRQAALRCTDVEISRSRVRLTLSRGSFATVALREIIKPSDPIAAGF